MSIASLDIPFVTTGRALEKQLEGNPNAHKNSPWSWSQLAGRLVELRNVGASSVLSFAFSLVHEAQQDGEPVAWIGATESLFYAPDVVQFGVDLKALALIRVRSARDAGRVADRLLRSGGFGLVILDLGADTSLPTPLQNRLVHRAAEHHAAVLCLTEEVLGSQNSSLGPLVSLRASALRHNTGGVETHELVVARDKRRGMKWRHMEERYGSPGMR